MPKKASGLDTLKSNNTGLRANSNTASYGQEFTPQFPANTTALMASAQQGKHPQSGSLSGQQLLQSKKVMIQNETERMIPPSIFDQQTSDMGQVESAASVSVQS